MCLRAIRPQNKNENLLEKNNYLPREGGGYPSMENSMKIIIFFLETFPKLYLEDSPILITSCRTNLSLTASATV